MSNCINLHYLWTKGEFYIIIVIITIIISSSCSNIGVCFVVVLEVVFIGLVRILLSLLLKLGQCVNLAPIFQNLFFFYF